MENYLLEEETYQIIGCCMEVHNELGFGFSEIVYKDALEYEFRKNGVLFAREVGLVINFKKPKL
ncbi:MAG: GxxExxY protein [Fluviicola sp.]